jgi:hypothetical protein
MVYSMPGARLGMSSQESTALAIVLDSRALVADFQEKVYIVA